MRRTFVCQNVHDSSLSKQSELEETRLRRSRLMFNFISRTLVRPAVLACILFGGTSTALAQVPQSTPRPTPAPGDPSRPPGQTPIPGTTTPTQNPAAPPATQQTNPPTAPPGA